MAMKELRAKIVSTGYARINDSPRVTIGAKIYEGIAPAIDRIVYMDMSIADAHTLMDNLHKGIDTAIEQKRLWGERSV